MNLDTHTPHVEPGWANDLLLELRLRGVDGRQIGAALAEVEAHCAESGESALDSFGDPTTYAVELALQGPAAAMDMGRELFSTAAGLGGMMATLAAVGAWQGGTQVQITTGFVGLLLLMMVGTALIVRLADRLLRAVVRHWWVAVVGSTVPIAVFVAVLMIGRQTLLTVPAPLVLVLGLLLLAANTVMALRGPDLDDPVVGPEMAGGAGTLDEGTAMRGLQRLGPWVFPILTGLMALPLLLLPL